MSEDHKFNKNQKKKEESELAPDFCGSLGKGMLAKGNFETLGRSSGLTPLCFGDDVDVSNKITDRYSDRDSISDGFSTTEGTEILKNSQGLDPIRPFGEKSFGLTPLTFDIQPQMNADERRCGCIGIENDNEKKENQRYRSISLSHQGEFHKRGGN